MKNKTVEAMVRCQFNIDEGIQVRVKSTGSLTQQFKTTYDFTVVWFEGDVQHTVKTSLPWLHANTIDFGETNENSC